MLILTLISSITAVHAALLNIQTSQPNRLTHTNDLYFVCLPIVCMVPVLMYRLHRPANLDGHNCLRQGNGAKILQVQTILGQKNVHANHFGAIKLGMKTKVVNAYTCL